MFLDEKRPSGCGVPASGQSAWRHCCLVRGSFGPGVAAEIGGCSIRFGNSWMSSPTGMRWPQSLQLKCLARVFSSGRAAYWRSVNVVCAQLRHLVGYGISPGIHIPPAFSGSDSVRRART